jgi:hypothetical protein
MKPQDELRAKLIEDTGSAEEADRLLPLVRQLPAWSAPTPTVQETDRLVQTLSAAVPTRRSGYLWEWTGWLLQAQLRVVQQEIWLASALVMVLGLFVTLTMRPGLAPEMLPLVWVAPLVAAVGVAFLYGPTADPALEIELAAPISPRLVVLARLLLVFAFDLILGLLSSVVLVLLHSGWSLWSLVWLWLAPMTFLAALAFLLSMLFVEPLISVSICLVLWGIQVIRAFPPFAAFPNWLAQEGQPWLWLLTALCVGVALWLAGREEHQLLKRI